MIGGQDTLAAADGGVPKLLGRAGPIDRGTVVGRYVILGELGAGGMGVVCAAYDPELDRKVALKFLLPHGADREAARARLQGEAQAMAKLSHPNVVAVHDVGLHAGRVWVAMEFVQGQTLTQWLAEAERRGPSPWPSRPGTRTATPARASVRRSARCSRGWPSTEAVDERPARD